MNEQSFEYRTGQTAPGKNHRGVLAFLLILVIFLCGVVSALGLMNIRLFRLLEQTGSQEETHLSFSQEPDPTAGEIGAALQISGMSCVEPGDVYRQLYDLPQGLYISHVEENSPAHLAGIAPGDMLVRIADTDTPDLASLQSLVDTFAGNKVTLTINRAGAHYQYDLFLTGETP